MYAISAVIGALLIELATGERGLAVDTCRATRLQEGGELTPEVSTPSKWRVYQREEVAGVTDHVSILICIIRLHCVRYMTNK